MKKIVALIISILVFSQVSFVLAAAVELYEMTLFSDANIKAYWRFESNSNDATANAQNGSDTNMSYAAAKFNNGAVFNGTNAKITLPSGASTPLDITGDLTIVTWIKTTDGTGGIIDCSDEGGYASGYQWMIGGGGAASGYMAFQTLNTSDSWAVENTTAVNDDTWRHIAVTLSGTTVKFYVNGSNVKTVTSQKVPASYSGSRTIGVQNNGSNYFAGMLDDKAVFNRALSDSEISDIYNGVAVSGGWEFYEID